HIGRRVIAKHTCCSRGPAARRATHTVDLRGAADGEHAAGHVIHIDIRVGSDLGDPGIGNRIVLEGISEVVAGYVRAASTHDIEAPVSREEDANGADAARGRKVRTGRPTGRATWGRCWTARTTSAADVKHDV